jgi:hypothetical protein
MLLNQILIRKKKLTEFEKFEKRLKMMKKKKVINKADLANQRIIDHEKLCRIMQAETHKKIDHICFRIQRLEYILMTSAGGVIVGLASLVIMLLNK